jgi:hypothetical protein
MTASPPLRRLAARLPRRRAEGEAAERWAPSADAFTHRPQSSQTDPGRVSHAVHIASPHSLVRAKRQSTSGVAHAAHRSARFVA